VQRNPKAMFFKNLKARGSEGQRWGVNLLGPAGDRKGDCPSTFAAADVVQVSSSRGASGGKFEISGKTGQ